MIVDDTHLLTGTILADFMAADPRWEEVTRDRTSHFAIYRKRVHPVHDDDWTRQPYVHDAYPTERVSFVRVAVPPPHRIHPRRRHQRLRPRASRSRRSAAGTSTAVPGRPGERARTPARGGAIARRFRRRAVRRGWLLCRLRPARPLRRQLRVCVRAGCRGEAPAQLARASRLRLRSQRPHARGRPDHRRGDFSPAGRAHLRDRAGDPPLPVAGAPISRAGGERVSRTETPSGPPATASGTRTSPRSPSPISPSI